MVTKKCSRCLLNKPTSDFYKDKTKKDGFGSRCKLCAIEQAKEWRINNTSRRNHLAQEWRKKNKDCINNRRRKWYHENESEVRSYQMAWRKKNPDNVRKSYLWTHYRITPEQFDVMLDLQDGRCAICRATEPGGRGEWHIDHDHECCPSNRRSCGKCIRALLCQRCNQGIGLFNDDVIIMKKAITYLTKHKRKKA